MLAHLEQKDRSATDGGAALLASHAERGEVWDKAAHYLIGSLSQAIRGSANHEAIGLYDRALKVLDRAIQVHGGGGVSGDFSLASAYAHLRTLRLADGPDEVHKLSIARRELAPYIPREPAAAG